MRVLKLGVAFAIALGCGGSNKPAVEAKSDDASKEKKLDCAFAKDVGNCWRAATAKLEACLGGKVSAPGKMQKDDPTLCALPEGVAAKFSQACDPDGKCDLRGVMLGKGDKKCAEIEATVEKAASEEGRGIGTLSLIMAEGTVKLEYDEKSKKVTCPDGTTYSGTGDWKTELSECSDEAGYQGVPAWAVTTTPSKKEGKKTIPGKVAIELASMETLFECQAPDGEPPPKKK